MRSFFDLFAIVSGVLGLIALVVHGTPLTPENVPLQATRALMVLTFVLVPFCLARALEKFDISAPLAWLRNQRAATRTIPLPPNAQPEPETLFFDYFFLPNSAQEWDGEPSLDTPAKTDRSQNPLDRYQSS